MEKGDSPWKTWVVGRLRSSLEPNSCGFLIDIPRGFWKSTFDFVNPQGFWLAKILKFWGFFVGCTIWPAMCGTKVPLWMLCKIVSDLAGLDKPSNLACSWSLTMENNDDLFCQINWSFGVEIDGSPLIKTSLVTHDDLVHNILGHSNQSIEKIY